jgi:drug/metabolite transporter (DMT)-like permease
LTVSRRQLLALAALTLMWGVNWPMMKLSLREISPLYFRALTMTGGAIWLYLFYRARGVRLSVQGCQEWRHVAAAGCAQHAGLAHHVDLSGVQELSVGSRVHPGLHHAGMDGADGRAWCWANG